MPTYEYQCMNKLCEHSEKPISESRSISDRENPIDCPVCYTAMKFVLSATPGRVVGGTPRHYR